MSFIKMSEMVDNDTFLSPGVSIKPILTLQDVSRLLYDNFRIKTREIKELIGYDDKNYYIKEDNCENGEYVFKVVNSLDSKNMEFFDAQNCLLMHLGKRGIKCPQPIPSNDGRYCIKVRLESGQHVIRVLEFIPGNVLHKTPLTPDLLYQIGELVGNMNVAMEDFHHEAYANHKPVWTLENVPKLRNFLFSLKDNERIRMCEDIINIFEVRILKSLQNFNKGMIHGDINEHNLLIDESNITAVLDFGDSHYGYYLFEIAITMTYMILEAKDLNAGGYVLAGYFSKKSLTDDEFSLLKVCIAGRLCQSLVMGAYSYSLEPGNDYLLTTAVNGWNILEKLWKGQEEELLKGWKEIALKFKK